MNPENSVVEEKHKTTEVIPAQQMGVISSTIDEEITPEEELQIAGYQPEQAALIDQEFLIQREGEQTEPQPESENPLIRLAIAALLIGGIMGFGWMIWAIFFTAKPIAKPVPTPTTPTAVATQSDEASRLKAELALRNQASQAEQPQQLPSKPRQQPTPTAPSPIRQKIAPAVRQSSPPPRIIREPALPPRIIKQPAPPPRIIRERVSVTPPQRPLVVPPTPTPQEQIDPFERWNQLATIGQQTIESSQGLSQDLPQSAELPQREAVASRATPAADTYTTSSPAIPVVQIGRTTENDGILRETSMSNSGAIPAVDYTYTTSTNEAVFEVQTDDEISNIDNQQTQTRSDYEVQTDDEMSNIDNPQIQTRGERGILNRTPQNFASSVAVSPDSPMQIQIGTSAKAKVLVPTIWAEEDKGSQGRFAVELQEDVLSTDNRVALPKGTILITEVESVTKANKLVKQSVVAVVYADSSGQIQQQTIPKDAILIRGEDSQPLIARGIEDRGSALAITARIANVPRHCLYTQTIIGNSLSWLDVESVEQYSPALVSGFDK